MYGEREEHKGDVVRVLLSYLRWRCSPDSVADIGAINRVYPNDDVIMPNECLLCGDKLAIRRQTIGCMPQKPGMSFLSQSGVGRRGHDYPSPNDIGSLFLTATYRLLSRR